MSKYIKLDDAIGIITEHQGIRGDTFKALHNAYAVDIVHCRECKWSKANGTYQWCGRLDSTARIKADDFCSYGCREERSSE